jgi:DNA-directed RNA polymerase
MSAIIRDTFIALHSSDILQKLRNEFMNRYKGYRVPLSSLTDRDLCSILVTLAHPDHPAPPQLLSTIRVLVNRSPSRFAKEEATRRAMTAAREKLSPTELEAGVESVEGAVELTPEEQADYSGVNPSEEDLGVLEDQAKKPKRKPARRPKGQVAAWKLDPDIQYIELTDILPMLPDKGNFNVEAIKDSQYFFS